MERLQLASLRLADRTATAVGALFDDVATAAAVVARANAASVTLADVGIAAEVLRQTGRATRPLGLRPTPVQTDRRRIVAALERILDEDIAGATTVSEIAASRRARVARFGSDETLLTVATATQQAVQARQPSGWVRRTDPDPCSLCRDWADGIVRPAATPMIRHRGCACLPQPLFT